MYTLYSCRESRKCRNILLRNKERKKVKTSRFIFNLTYHNSILAFCLRLKKREKKKKRLALIGFLNFSFFFFSDCDKKNTLFLPLIQLFYKRDILLLSLCCHTCMISIFFIITNIKKITCLGIHSS